MGEEECTQRRASLGDAGLPSPEGREAQVPEGLVLTSGERSGRGWCQGGHEHFQAQVNQGPGFMEALWPHGHSQLVC